MEVENTLDVFQFDGDEPILPPRRRGAEAQKEKKDSEELVLQLL
jgi:hypothetical protein